MGRYGIITFLTIGSAFAGPWLRLASPNFEIYAQTDEAKARRVLTRFEQARRVLSSARWGAGAETLTRVILFSSARDFAAVRPSANVRGFYQSGPDRDYIVLLEGAELDRIILHEYTHSVLNHGSAPLPQWLEEGLAELYSTLSVNDRQATAGASIPTHIATLERDRWLTAQQIASVSQKSPEYNEAGKTGIFYAQSWAFTHMLTFAEPYRGRMAGFTEALASGQPQQSAFASAFGATMDTAMSQLPAYLRLGFRTIDLETTPPDKIPFTGGTVLDASVAEQSAGEILLLMGRDEQARKVYEDIARRFPESPGAHTGLAVVAMHDRDYERARGHFEHAMELGANDGSTYFEYAMLLRDTGADAELVTRFLEKAIAANPAYAEAHFLIGLRAADAGRVSEAVEHLRRATAILPRQAYFWQALSFAEIKLGHVGEARTAAMRALRAASTDHETEMAKNALKLIDGPEQPPNPKHDAGVITPKSWTNPKGDRVIAGDLVQVDCRGTTASLHVRTAAETLVLTVANPQSVVIRGGPAQQSLSCGAQASGIAVRVEFVAATNLVTGLEFVER